MFVRDMISTASEGGIEMKELLKSKCMVGFLLLMVCFLFVNAHSVQKMNESRGTSEKTYVAMNS